MNRLLMGVIMTLCCPLLATAQERAGLKMGGGVGVNPPYRPYRPYLDAVTVAGVVTEA